METINSKIFGSVVLLDKNENTFIALKALIEQYPVNAFGIINRQLNTKGFLCVIDVLPEPSRGEPDA